MHKVYLDKEYHTAPQQDTAYLRPVLAQIEAEVESAQVFDNLTSIPAALAKRNRSSW